MERGVHYTYVRTFSSLYIYNINIKLLDLAKVYIWVGRSVALHIVLSWRVYIICLCARSLDEKYTHIHCTCSKSGFIYTERSKQLDVPTLDLSWWSFVRIYKAAHLSRSNASQNRVTCLVGCASTCLRAQTLILPLFNRIHICVSRNNNLRPKEFLCLRVTPHLALKGFPRAIILTCSNQTRERFPALWPLHNSLTNTTGMGRPRASIISLSLTFRIACQHKLLEIINNAHRPCC
jgi:hypothetical protein